MEVPDRRTPSRPRSRLPGLTIHLREGEEYREVEESRAFPGWRAAEIHAAMNEETPSEETYAVLERVGRALGAREGTGPDDDPLLRAQRREGFEQGRLRGREEGREAGLEEGLARGRLCTVRRILRSRGIAVSDDFDAAPSGLAEHSGAALVDAALACESEADFLALLLHTSERPRHHPVIGVSAAPTLTDSPPRLDRHALSRTFADGVHFPSLAALHPGEWNGPGNHRDDSRDSARAVRMVEVGHLQARRTAPPPPR